MAVVLAIISILAMVTIPYAEVVVKRQKEMELRQNLRAIRSAIDDFHNDWRLGKVPASAAVASDDGYPRTLNVLVEGVEKGGISGQRKYYLRRIPRNPFVDQSIPLDQQWHYRGYQDRPDAQNWNSQDVYDVTFASESLALDGSPYAQW